MSEPYLGEIRIASFNFAPSGWALCNGQLMPINQNQALFSILGTMYGGNGQTTFALPNLQGRIPLHTGNGYSVGQSGGEVAHALTVGELPAHTHVGRAQSAPASPGTSPLNSVPATGPAALYGASVGVAMRPSTVAFVGGGQPHANEAPYLTVTMMIALQGIFPSRN